MEQSRSWTANIAPGDKHIPLILWDPVLDRMNPVYVFHHIPIKIHLNIILQLYYTLNTFAQPLCCPLLFLQ